MKCPNDDTVLVMTDRQGIEIDYCPQCRGVWLDRGELDKIIERTTPTTSHVKSEEVTQRYEERPREHREYDDRKDSYGKDHHYKKRRKESFLGDIFDF